jgi:hypothetical protein
MRWYLTIPIIALLALACAHLTFAGEGEGRAIIEKSIKAIGGEKAIEKHKAVSFSEKGTYYGMGEGLPFTSKLNVQLPDQFRMEVEGIFTLIINGDKGWVSMMGETKAMDKEKLANEINGHRAGYMSTLLPLRDKNFTIKKLADAKVGDQNANVVEASRKDWPTVKLFFDSTTNYLVKMEHKGKAEEQGFKEVTVDHNFSDFKEVDGLKVPYKGVMNRDGKVFVEYEITSYRAVGKLDQKIFAKPE